MPDDSRAEGILVIRGLEKSFPREIPWAERLGRLWGDASADDDVRALADVSFALRTGETLGILGESGSGKSTIARILMGIYAPDAGSGTLEGKPLFGSAPTLVREQRRRMQMVFQDPFSSLDPRMSVRRLLAEPLSIHGIPGDPPGEERFRKGLAEVGLEESVLDRYPNEFSGGQRQRIGICRALLLDPAVLIADEAVSALDVSIQAQILDVLVQLRASRRLSMLFISHDVAVVRHVADRILVLLRGRVVEEFPVSCLLKDIRHPYTRRLVGAALALREEGRLPDVPPPSLAHDLGTMPKGCGLCSSCPEASARCAEPPPLHDVHPGHQVACWAAVQEGQGSTAPAET